MREQKDILVIKQIIHEVIPYEKKIYFFGSRAKGDYDVNSDYDLLVVVQGKSVSRRELIASQAKVRRLCAKAGFDVDVIVRDLSYSEEMRHFPGNIINAAFQTGVSI